MTADGRERRPDRTGAGFDGVPAGFAVRGRNAGVCPPTQRAIARQAARPGFLFGCNGYGLASGYPEALNLYQALFNYTTIPIHEGWVEPQKEHLDYTAFEAALNTLIGTTILHKGHPGIWLEPENTPKWLHDISYDETKRYCLAHVARGDFSLPTPSSYLGRGQRGTRAAGNKPRHGWFHA